MAAKLSASSSADAGDDTEQAVRQIESRPILIVVLAFVRTTNDKLTIRAAAYGSCFRRDDSRQEARRICAVGVHRISPQHS
ncbi:hypothetical protein [Bradyrhizobium quebecense]|uniref:Uncharacterized protein n=2 Tax=Bradyrhizobium quebecense TaxID=2748629 RepID=A0ABS3MA07_9BRAD|nr:hypothetical protein [Bradyrhizobium quebecense]UGY03597.1 hypothetical protein J4P68_0002120 [Bradyrhizobium quebecense]